MVDQYKLYGKLLNYPDCCIEHFRVGGSWTTNGGVSHHGFVPCPKHAKEPYEVLVKMIGRDIKNGPIEFWMFTHEVRRAKSWASVFEVGKDIYRQVGKESFFVNCWNASLENSTE